MICPQCQATNERDSMYCGNCGTSLTRSVPVMPGPGGPRPQSTIMADPEAPARPGAAWPPDAAQTSYHAFSAPADPYSPGALADQYDRGTPSGAHASRAPGNYDSPSVPVGQYPSSSAGHQYGPGPQGSPYPPGTPGEQYAPGAMGHQNYSPGGAPARARAFHLDLRRLSRVDQTVGGASLIVLISLFLPWYGLTVLGTSITIGGTTAHGYLVLAVLLAVFLIAYLLLRSGWDEFPANLPVAHAPLLLIGTGLQFLLVIIGFFDVPGSGLSWEIGAYLAVLASVTAAGPVIVPAIRSWQASR